jgi:choline dehydrogenase-like flavoprotein
MVYTRGSRDDYDRWAATMGDDNLSWEKMLPFILKVCPNFNPSSFRKLTIIQRQKGGPLQTIPTSLKQVILIHLFIMKMGKLE